MGEEPLLTVKAKMLSLSHWQLSLDFNDKKEPVRRKPWEEDSRQMWATLSVKSLSGKKIFKKLKEKKNSYQVRYSLGAPGKSLVTVVSVINNKESVTQKDLELKYK